MCVINTYNYYIAICILHALNDKRRLNYFVSYRYFVLCEPIAVFILIVNIKYSPLLAEHESEVENIHM